MWEPFGLMITEVKNWQLANATDSVCYLNLDLHMFYH